MAKTEVVVDWANGLSYWLHDLTKFLANIFTGWFLIVIFLVVGMWIIIYFRFIRNAATSVVVK